MLRSLEKIGGGLHGPPDFFETLHRTPAAKNVIFAACSCEEV